MAAWAAEAQRQKAARAQHDAAAGRRGRQQEVDDSVRLGQARRLVAAVERALHILEQQVP